MNDSPVERMGSGQNSRRSEESSRTKRAPRKRDRATRQGFSEAKRNLPKKEPKIVKPNPSKKESNNERKAPTPLAGKKLAKAKKRKRTVVVGFLLLLGVISSAAVGYIDEGQIDVKKTIDARNERIRNNVANEDDVLTSSVEIPVQNTNINNKPDGGLIGRGVGANNPVPKEEPNPLLASSTATSSLEMASSSEVSASSSDEAATEEEGGQDDEEEDVQALE